MLRNNVYVSLFSIATGYKITQKHEQADES